MLNRLPVLARKPPLSASTVVTGVGAGLDCESFELSFVMHSICTFAVLGVEFLLDCDFELVGFLAALAAGLPLFFRTLHSHSSRLRTAPGETPQTPPIVVPVVRQALWERRDAQRCSKRGTIIQLLGLQWLREDIDPDLIVSGTTW